MHHRFGKCMHFHPPVEQLRSRQLRPKPKTANKKEHVNDFFGTGIVQDVVLLGTPAMKLEEFSALGSSCSIQPLSPEFNILKSRTRANARTATNGHTPQMVGGRPVALLAVRLRRIVGMF